MQNFYTPAGAMKSFRNESVFIFHMAWLAQTAQRKAAHPDGLSILLFIFVCFASSIRF